MAWRRLCRLGALVAVAAAVVVGCRAPAPLPSATQDVAAQVANRFPHTRHADIACTECHALGSVLAGVPAVPGADEHAPCDRGNCHRERFTSAPSEFCEICHSAVEPARAGASANVPYPPERGRRALAARFAHARHLDFALMEESVGFHVTCLDCHARDSQGAPTRPGHSVCARCHAPEAARSGMPAMDRCESCHASGGWEPERTRQFIKGDLHFRHGNHVVDRRGKGILCVECHADTPAVQSILDHAGPTTSACVTCHDNTDRVPPSERMRVCETCHAARARSIGVLAPRSHLPKLERPEDHTLAFVGDHGDPARESPQRCAGCHTFMSGARRDTCDECHQVMRPRDHVITWREFDHGPEASARADRCATCHKGTFCSTCHAVRPRSHLGDFGGSGHALPAKLDIRACFTCHDPVTSCASCHTLGGAR